MAGETPEELNARLTVCFSKIDVIARKLRGTPYAFALDIIRRALAEDTYRARVDPDWPKGKLAEQIAALADWSKPLDESAGALLAIKLEYGFGVGTATVSFVPKP